jgi:hypothetical protein
MPTLTQVKLPVPKDWNEFEDIVASAIISLRPITPSQRFGRQGQAQHGVDILFEDFMCRMTGVQCKNVETLTLGEINAEISKAESYDPHLESYVFAVTFPRDAKIHKQINLLSVDRSRHGKFRVGIWFWDDIAFFLSREPAELSRHYPDFFSNSSALIANHSAVQNGIAADRIKALKELWALRHRILPPKRHPDMEWEEVLEEIAFDLHNHAQSLRDISQRLGSTLPKDVAALLARAEAEAVIGSFEVSLDDEMDVPIEARNAADRMYELLTEGIEKTRVSIKALGIDLD